MGQLVRAIVVASLVLWCSSCDSGESDNCDPIDELSYTASAPVVSFSDDVVARVELQQTIRTFPEDCVENSPSEDEIRLVVRNLTACDLSFRFTMSLIQAGEGFTVDGSVSIRPDAASDQGVIARDSKVRVDMAQILLTGSDFALESCPFGGP